MKHSISVSLLSSLCVGIDVGTLPTLAHGVGGTLQFLSTSQLKLRGFSYDGAGPGEGVSGEGEEGIGSLNTAVRFFNYKLCIVAC